MDEERMRELGMTDQDIRRAKCEHAFGDTCYWTFMGCYRTCSKCGQRQVDPKHCGQHKGRSE